MRIEQDKCPWCKAVIKSKDHGILFNGIRNTTRTIFLCGVVQICYWSLKRGTQVIIERSCKARAAHPIDERYKSLLEKPEIF